MFLILIKSDSRFPVDRKRVKRLAERVLKEKSWGRKVEVSLAFVKEKEMKRLNREYRALDKTASVLSFSQLEKERAGHPFVSPPGDVLRLGDVVICYPEARRLAKKEGVSTVEEIDRLTEHGLRNLLRVNS